jgi:DnaJ-class molecular chaperone
VWWFWKRLPKIQSGTSGGGGASSSARSDGGGTTTGRFDPYEVLGISRSASKGEIRQAYHDQLRQYHPDKVDDLGEELQKLAHGRTLDIRRAYDELKRG